MQVKMAAGVHHLLEAPVFCKRWKDLRREDTWREGRVAILLVLRGLQFLVQAGVQTRWCRITKTVQRHCYRDLLHQCTFLSCRINFI